MRWRSRGVVFVVVGLLALALLLLPTTQATFSGSTGTLTQMTASEDFAVGALYKWGLNTTPQQSPSQVGRVATWSQVASGSEHTCGVRTDFSLWCWGTPGTGELGLNTVTSDYVYGPARVGSGNYFLVSSGVGTTCAIRTTATLWCWGKNGSGQLGLGDTTDRSAPVQVGTSGDWLRVAEGEVSGCGVRSGGTRPDTDWTSVSNGVLHTCGLRTDGTLWCWGSSANGQLGLGDTTQHSTPTQVGTGTSWLSLGVGSAHTCAVRIDVTLWCWGFNGTGQLGLSDYADRTAPVQVPGVRSAYVTATWFGTYATQFVP